VAVQKQVFVKTISNQMIKWSTALLFVRPNFIEKFWNIVTRDGLLYATSKLRLKTNKTEKESLQNKVKLNFKN